MIKHIIKTGVTAVALLLTATVMAQTRIALLSDTHVMGPGLMVNDGPAWQEVITTDRKLHEYSRDILEKIVDKAIAEKTDLMLITGDLTKDGELLSHKCVVSQLDRLRAAGIKCYVIPGNHDLGTRHALYFDGDKTRLAEVADASQFATLYRNYGYGPDSHRDTASLSYCCEPIEGLVLIGLDTGRNGILSESTLQWTLRQAAEARKKGKLVLGMMHHSLLNHFNRESSLMERTVVNDWETTRNRLADAGIQVMFTGHFHVSDISKDYNADLSRHIYDISTGSTTTYPCDYRQMTLSADKKELAIETVRLTSLPGQDQFRELAKRRMTESTKAFAKEIIPQDIIADLAAAALIVFAEGNEDQSDEAREFLNAYQFGKLLLSGNTSLVERLKSIGLSLSNIEAVLYSILTDRSSYGIQGREDKTDDLTLTIKLQ